MARKVEVKGPGANGLLLTIDKALASPTVLRVISQWVRERIYNNTKRGYYAGARKNLAKLKPLSAGYIKHRKRLVSDMAKGFRSQSNKRKGDKQASKQARQKAISKFGPFFSPARSNLTFTGQMLEALIAEVVDGEIRVQVDSTSRKGEDITNAEVAAKVAKDGRPFLRLDDRGVDRIRESIIRSLRRLLKNR